MAEASRRDAALTIDENDPGASYANNQPPDGANPGDMLTMKTPLAPFLREDGMPYLSADCVDIVGQLDYDDGPGSLDEYAAPTPPAEATLLDDEPSRQIHISGIDRSKIAVSFVVAAYAEIDGARRLVGAEAILSRWTVSGCANCQTELRASSNFRVASDLLSGGDVKVGLHTRHDALGDAPSALSSAGQVGAAARETASAIDLPFHMEIR